MGKAKFFWRRSRSVNEEENNDDAFARALRTVREEREQRERLRIKVFSQRKTKPTQ